MIDSIHASTLKMLSRCPHQFELYQKLGPIPPGIAAHIGSSVHKAAETNHRAKLSTGQDEGETVLVDVARDTLQRKLDDEGVFLARDEVASAETIIAEGIDSTVRLTQTWRREIASSIFPALIEKKIALEVSDLEVPIVGTIDCLDTSENLIDLKTSSKSWTQSQADEELQPVVYRQLVKSETGSYPRSIRFDVLVKSKEIKVQKIETTRDESDWQAFLLRARAAISQIKSGIFPPCLPGWNCSEKWCGYWSVCEYVPARAKILPRIK